MSSPNLPAGFSITTIDGQRCTAVPRSLTTLTGDLATAAAAQPPTTTASVPASTTPSAAPTTLATSVVPAPVPDTSSESIADITSIPLVSKASSPTSAVPAIITTQNLSPSSSAPALTSAIAASKSTTPTTSSSTPLAVAQSEVHASPTAPTGENNGIETSAPSVTTSPPPVLITSPKPEESAANTDVSSQPKVTTAPVVGGVLGSMALIAIVGLLFWFLRRRRRRRESLLTPLTTGRRSSFYTADNSSVGPSGRGNKWKTELGYQTDRVHNVGSNIKAGIIAVGASLKSKVSRERSDTPNVNLNRGNSQFLDGPISQHSRTNSTASVQAHDNIKRKATDWWDRLKGSMPFGMGKKSESGDPFAAARSMNEKRAMANSSPDFSQLLGMDDRDLQIQAERRRASLAGNTGSLPQLGALGLNFNNPEDPFADPKKASMTPGWKPPNGVANGNPFSDPAPNPFADPLPRPDPTIPKPNTYIADIRRSRGQSIDNTNTLANNTTSMYRPPSGAVESRYPSSLAPSRDSYRDTVFSTFSSNVRKGKGRSDPFDLERPELWKPRESNMNMYPNPLNGLKGGQSAYQQNQRAISVATFTSKYSSGVSSLGDWGEPGPALNTSVNSSLRGNASSNGGSGDYTRGKPTLEDMVSPVSPISRNSSIASSKNGVGKAM